MGPEISVVIPMRNESPNVEGLFRELTSSLTPYGRSYEILAIDDVRVRADGLVARLDQYKPSDKVALLVARRDRLTRIEVTLGVEPGRPFRLEVDPDASEAQKSRLISWLGQ